jgi:hypothetical protein
MNYNPVVLKMDKGIQCYNISAPNDKDGDFSKQEFNELAQNRLFMQEKLIDQLESQL